MQMLSKYAHSVLATFVNGDFLIFSDIFSKTDQIWREWFCQADQD